MHVCSIAQFISAIAFTGIVVPLKDGELQNFNCFVGPESTTAYKTEVEKACYLRYQEDYNAVPPFYIFVILSSWFPLVVAVFYALCVKRRVEQVDCNTNIAQPDSETGNQERNTVSFYVYYSYLFHLVVRVLFGILFATLHYAVLFPNGFDVKFSCLPPTGTASTKSMNVSYKQSTTTPFDCENNTASSKYIWWIAVPAFNCFFAVVTLVEVICTRRKFPKRASDRQFIVDYLLQKRYKPIKPTPDNIEPTPDNIEPTSDNIEPTHDNIEPTHDNIEPTPDNIEPTSDNIEPTHDNIEPTHDNIEPTPDNIEPTSDNIEPTHDNIEPTHDNIEPTPDNIEPTTNNIELIPDNIEPTPDNIELTPVFISLQECIDFYKSKVLRPLRSTDIMHGTKTGLDDFLVKLAVYTGRAPRAFSKHMKRHEIYNVYDEVLQDSIRLNELKDLFLPNKDTENKPPRTILAVGRPGIGKTVLTEKIMRDWARGVVELYDDKIALYFKMRLFSANEFKNITLKTFLRCGTGLSDKNFEKIYEYITKHPKKVILIFDGLDEFKGISDHLNNVPPLDDPNIFMSAISMFVKLISGNVLLPEATILVTSRPTANEVYSRFPFDRTVEIIGFSNDEIEEYVEKFSDNHGKSNLKSAIWNHIKSSSDLLNSCYIPVNCFIITTIIFEYLKNPKNVARFLPVTLTELYQAAVAHFDAYHFRKADGQSSDTAAQIQLTAFEGIKNGNLLFTNDSFDEQMSKSGLVNKLSNPYSETQQQFCFIHLTMQEFLAAKHVTETFSKPEDVKKFITSHISNGRWHLVLQFIAGLMGKKIRMSQREYCKDWALQLAKRVYVNDGRLDLTDNITLCVIKCLREIDDEDITKQACEKTSMNNVRMLVYKPRLFSLSSSDWAAVNFVCKRMKELRKLDFSLVNSVHGKCHVDVNEILKQKCLRELVIKGSKFDMKFIFQSLLKSNCALSHECSKLTELDIGAGTVDHDCLRALCDFFKKGHARFLVKFLMSGCAISGLSTFYEIFYNELCPELSFLELSYNQILDEGAKELCARKLTSLTQLYLERCGLSDECISSICGLLTDEGCNLSVLSLSCNKGISNEGVRLLCKEALVKKLCKLKELNLSRCSFNDECARTLSETLQNDHCQLTVLYLEASSLTDEYIPEISKALQGKCKLTVLSLAYNRKITNEGLGMLCKLVLTRESCKLRNLNMFGCSLSDDCIPYLSKALQDEHCTLNELTLAEAAFSLKGKRFPLELNSTVSVFLI